MMIVPRWQWHFIVFLLLCAASAFYVRPSRGAGRSILRAMTDKDASSQQRFYGIGVPPATLPIVVPAEPIVQQQQQQQQQQPRPGLFGRIRSAVGRVFSNRTRPQEKVLRVDYEPSGLLGHGRRFLRRRLLNIFNRTPKNWAKAVEGSTMNKYTAWSAESKGRVPIPSSTFSIDSTAAATAAAAAAGKDESLLQRLQKTWPFGGNDADKRKEIDARERRVFRQGVRPSQAPPEKRGPLSSLLSLFQKKEQSARSVTAVSRMSYIETLDSRRAKPEATLSLDAAIGAVGGAASKAAGAVGSVGQALAAAPGNLVVSISRIFIPAPTPEAAATAAAAASSAAATEAPAIEPPSPASALLTPPAPPPPPPAPLLLATTTSAAASAAEKKEEKGGFFRWPLASVAQNTIFSTTSLPQVPGLAIDNEQKQQQQREGLQSAARNADQKARFEWPWDRFYRGDMPFFDNGAVNPQATASISSIKAANAAAAAASAIAAAPAAAVSAVQQLVSNPLPATQATQSSQPPAPAPAVPFSAAPEMPPSPSPSPSISESESENDNNGSSRGFGWLRLPSLPQLGFFKGKEQEQGEGGDYSEDRDRDRRRRRGRGENVVGSLMALEYPETDSLSSQEGGAEIVGPRGYRPLSERAREDALAEEAAQEALAALQANANAAAAAAAAEAAAAAAASEKQSGFNPVRLLPTVWGALSSAANTVFPVSASILTAPIKLVEKVASSSSSSSGGAGQEQLADAVLDPIAASLWSSSAGLAPVERPSWTNATASFVLSTLASAAPGARLLVTSLRDRKWAGPPSGVKEGKDNVATPALPAVAPDYAALTPPSFASASASASVSTPVYSPFDEESPLHDSYAAAAAAEAERRRRENSPGAGGWLRRLFSRDQRPDQNVPASTVAASSEMAAEERARPYRIETDAGADLALEGYDPAFQGMANVPFPLMTEFSNSAVPASTLAPPQQLQLQQQQQGQGQGQGAGVETFPPPPTAASAAVRAPATPGASAAAYAFGSSLISQLPSLPSIGMPSMPTLPQSLQNFSLPLPRMSLGSTLSTAYAASGYGAIPPMGPVDDSLTVKMGGSAELRTIPGFLVDEDRVPLPTQADFDYIDSRKVELSVAAATAIQSPSDAAEFLTAVGLQPLIKALLLSVDKPEMRSDAIHGLCCLIRAKKSVAGDVAALPQVLNVLTVTIEAPLRGFKTFVSQAERNRELKDQTEALALVQRMVRSSDRAVSFMSADLRLKKALGQIVAQSFLMGYREADGVPGTGVYLTAQQQLGGTQGSNAPASSGRPRGRSMNSTTIIDYKGLAPHQMARVAMWGLGGVAWRPRQPGQRGLRILSLDGGGTKGVLSIAILKEVMKRAGSERPHEMFDIICGTSTGGIIAVVLGCQRKSVSEMETLYDDFIAKVFGKGSSIKLVSERAFYDENELEKVLYDICGDTLLLDSNQKDCSRVFCVSTKVNNNPPQTFVWRNYNYPPGQASRYPGTFRANSLTAVRATTAAPTFFTPVQWEGGLYCDGALVANNPTAIALQEAKALYPGVPIELVLSIGTGFNTKASTSQSLGWDLLVNQIVASTTDTEDVHSMLMDFLPADKYFRFNPILPEAMPIDEKNKSALLDLKRLAKQTFLELEKGPPADAKRLADLVGILKRR